VFFSFIREVNCIGVNGGFFTEEWCINAFHKPYGGFYKEERFSLSEVICIWPSGDFLPQ
jgi:hypothetical protein